MVKRNIDSGRVDSLGRLIKVSGAAQNGSIEGKKSMFPPQSIISKSLNVPYLITIEHDGNEITPDDAAQLFSKGKEPTVSMSMGVDEIVAESNRFALWGHDEPHGVSSQGHMVSMPLSTFMKQDDYFHSSVVTIERDIVLSPMGFDALMEDKVDEVFTDDVMEDLVSEYCQENSNADHISIKPIVENYKVDLINGNMEYQLDDKGNIIIDGDDVFEYINIYT